MTEHQRRCLSHLTGTLGTLKQDDHATVSLDVLCEIFGTKERFHIWLKYNRRWLAEFPDACTVLMYPPGHEKNKLINL